MKIIFKILNLDIIKIYFIIYVYLFLFLLRIYNFKIINSNIFLNFEINKIIYLPFFLGVLLYFLYSVYFAKSEAPTLAITSP